MILQKLSLKFTSAQIGTIQSLPVLGENQLYVVLPVEIIYTRCMLAKHFNLVIWIRVETEVSKPWKICSPGEQTAVNMNWTEGQRQRKDLLIAHELKKP